MPPRQLTSEIRRIAELQYAELVGRLHACEHLENEIERIQVPQILYGWNLLTQEILIRLSESALKLLYLLHFNKQPPKGHSLAKLWAQLPKPVQEEVEAKRRSFPGGERGTSFDTYSMDEFQNVRYSYERIAGGETVSFEVRRLFFDSFAAVDLAQEWLGEIEVWPWAGLLSSALSKYKILPLNHGRFEVIIDEPIEPMDWAGAIIEPQDGRYTWTLYFGFTKSAGDKRSFELPSLYYPWPIEDLFHDDVGECAEQIYRAYQEPCPALLQAIHEAMSA